MQIQVKISGDKQLLTKLRSFTAELYNWTDEMKQIGEELTSYYGGQVFSSRGGVFDGAVWASLSPEYKLRKLKKYPGKGILEASGTMRQSFKATHTKESVQIENTAKQFKYHQSSEARSIMPRRQMLGVNPGVEGIVGQIMTTGTRQRLSKI